MRKLFISSFLAAAILAAFFLAAAPARGQGGVDPNGEVILKTETQGETTRQISGPAGPNLNSPQSPTIGFIDSPTFGCYQPDPHKDECVINWYYLQVDAGPNYMNTMTVTLNEIGTVARYQGFFQNAMYVPYNMGNGYKVACGALGAGGSPTLGNAYGWTIRAKDSANLGAANYGTVYCPAYVP